MKSKKILPIFLAAFSCSSSNAYENNFQIPSGPQFSTNSPGQMMGSANFADPTKLKTGIGTAANPANTQFKPNIPNTPNTPNNLAGQNQKNNKKSSGYGKLAIVGIVGLAIGAGGTVYISQVMDSQTPTESYDFLWPCVQLSYNYRTIDRTKEYDKDPAAWTSYSMSTYLLYGLWATDHAGPYTSLFRALNKLYLGIKNSKEFKKLQTKEDKILKSLNDFVIGMPSATQDENTKKWTVAPYDNTKVSVDMLSDSEIKTKGFIKDDNGDRLDYHATFKRKGDLISLKEWSIDKQED